MPTYDSLQLTIAAIAGVGVFLGGLGTFLAAALKLRSLWQQATDNENAKESRSKKQTEKSRVEKETQTMKKKYVRTAVLGLAAAGAGLSLSIWATGSGELPLNAQLTQAAWEALEDEDFQTALAKTEACIEEFEGAALLEQEALEESDEPAPPEGQVSEEVAKKIHSRGLLNDVATCFFIQGRAYEKLSRIADAKAAYEKAARFTYARAWDPKGWFWSPASAAKGRLRTLGGS